MRTPNGYYRPYMLDRNHRSTLYQNAPMPWSVFFHGNFAIHGTTSIGQLGRPAEEAIRLGRAVMDVRGTRGRCHHQKSGTTNHTKRPSPPVPV